MATITRASQQWSSRPADQRFLSLTEMHTYKHALRTRSRSVVTSSRAVTVQADLDQADHTGLLIAGPSGAAYAPTHWSFGQLAALSGAPAGYLRGLPAELAADCLNYGLKINRDVEDVGLLLHKPADGGGMLAAATGPRYGRVWDADVLDALINRFGDGVTGEWRVPGEFGEAVGVTRQNTTLYASDRDMFVFLADEKNRIEVPNRRNGEAGTLARGFFVWNSEVGNTTLGIGTFLFDFVCSNRIVWGAEGYKEIKVRHTASAPDRFIEEVAPALEALAASSTANLTQAIADARQARLDKSVDEFLVSRQFGKGQIAAIKISHEADENRPMETLWDVTTGITAYARTIPHQDARVALEREAGAIMALAT